MSGAHSKSNPLGALVAETVASAAVVVSVGGMAISLALLIFTGAAAVELPRAIGSFLVGASILSAVLAWRGRLVPTVGVLQDGPAVVMVPVAAGIAASPDLGPTAVFVALGAVGLATAVAMLALSRMRVTGVVRYLPTSVVVAFIAGTGWYLAKGGLEIMVGHELTLRGLDEFLGWSELRRWLPGAVLALVIVTFGRMRSVSPIASSMAVVATVVIFYIVVPVVASVSTVEAEGWLIGPFPDGAAAELIGPDDLETVDWGAFAVRLPGLLAVVAIAVIAMLLNYSGLEMLTGERTDQRNELEATGLAALLTVPFGSVVGFIGLGDTMLARQLGIRRRVTSVMVAVVVGAVAFIGIDMVAMVPRIVAGGLLLAIGLELLVNWVQQLRTETSRTDVAIGVVVVAVMAAVGILEGLAVGVVVMCALFVVRYSRIDHVRRLSSGIHKGRVERSPEQAQFLLDRADNVVVIELEGYLFFGSVVAVVDRVREVCTAGTALDALIVDFRHVSGIDANGLATIESMGEMVRERGASFVLAGLDATAEAGLAAISSAAIESHRTLNRALEAVEERQLAERGRETEQQEDTGPLLPAELRGWFVEVAVVAGDIVVQEGDPSSTMFVVEQGSLIATKVDADGSEHRLRRFGEGAFVGEIGFFSGEPRSATVVAGTDARLLRLELDAYVQMRSAHPERALALHELVLQGQAARVRTLSDELARALGS